MVLRLALVACSSLTALSCVEGPGALAPTDAGGPLAPVLVEVARMGCAGCPFSVAVGPTGELLLAGRFTGSADFGGGPLRSRGLEDSFVTKLDATGRHQWTRHAGEPGSEQRRAATAVTVTPQGDVVVAERRTYGPGAREVELVIGRFSPAGEPIAEARLLAGPESEVRDLVPASDGALYAAGYFSGTIELGQGHSVSARRGRAGYPDALVVKLEAGRVAWAWSGGDVGPDQAHSVATTPSGDVVVTGIGTALGQGEESRPPERDPWFVTRLDPAGRVRWRRVFAGALNNKVTVAVDRDRTILGGTFTGAAAFDSEALMAGGPSDVFLVDLDGSGRVITARRLGGAYYDQFVDLALDVSGVVVVGRFQGWTSDVSFGGPRLSAPVGAWSAYAVRFDGGGRHVWTAGLDRVEPHALALSARGGAYVSASALDRDGESRPLVLRVDR
jgi:hypothetical protein